MIGNKVRELNMETPKYPLLFGKFPNAVAGHGDDIPITKLIQDEQVDYEAELAVVIGKECKDVQVEDAMEYVLGYTCSNDLSARFVTHSTTSSAKVLTRRVQEMANRPRFGWYLAATADDIRKKF